MIKTSKSSRAIVKNARVTLPLPPDIINHTVPKIRQLFKLSSSGRDDKRFETHKFEVQTEQKDDDFRFIGDIPEGIQELVLHGYHYQVPPGTPCSVFIGLYTRHSYMAIDPPNKSVGRMIINLLAKDVYIFDPLPTSDIPRRDPMIDANTFFLLAPNLITNYRLIVGRNPKIKSSESGINSIRPAKYERITIIIDYHVTEEKAEEIGKFANNLLSSKSELNKIAKTIGGKIKKPFRQKTPSDDELDLSSDEDEEDIAEAMTKARKEKLANMNSDIITISDVDKTIHHMNLARDKRGLSPIRLNGANKQMLLSDSLETVKINSASTTPQSLKAKARKNRKKKNRKKRRK